MTAGVASEASAYGLQAVVEEVHARALPDGSGHLADYIPELAQVSPDAFGLAVATTDGHLCSAGDADAPFTIQSISKAFAYCIALELLGRDKVLEHVGVEPSGDAFNAIVFDPATNRPYNPMVNAGAIAVAGLIQAHAGAEAFDLVLDRLSAAAGRPLDMDDAVYRSEATTGHRNKGIAHLLRATGAIRGDADAAVDLYFRVCAIRVTAANLARMGATLANIGENPVTGRAAFAVDAVRATLSVMFTCGMYDYAGNWALDVGVPAKSGVGGGILGVVNRQLGIGTFSPRLDAKGNSARGIRAFHELAEELGLHVFDPTNRGSALLGVFRS
ncbi:glutaminase A [Xanthobacter tagetidis]|uniref:Glutaminase n=1 Tax=Xanthobacter tagetidis TaxID=60216 RepID=A0A3L7ACI9_9HYPH|nr:glutaminase A [Xanthobacter tagetidis]MBB6306181.1 glutaminase [Xanthobacter tagetidis]RLP77725.1 glutaminase A [Xanthobacter tagetidis]